jgi:hypothetical protein
MKKLKLNVEELRVDGFTTAAANAREGTVIGHLPPTVLQCTRYCSQGESCIYICP